MSPLSPLTSCSPYLANSMAAVASEPDQLQVLNILCTAGHISLPLLRSFIRINTSRRHVFIFRNYTIFTVRSRHHLDQPPTWTTTPYRLSPTTYSIYSQLPSILKAVPPSANWGRAMPRLQGPTYHISYLAAIFTIMLLAPQSTHRGDERASCLWFDVRTHWNWTPCEWEMWIFNLPLLFVSLHNLTAFQNSFHIHIKVREKRYFYRKLTSKHTSLKQDVNKGGGWNCWRSCAIGDFGACTMGAEYTDVDNRISVK